jgi:2-phosphosulfolactate phosphatase
MSGNVKSIEVCFSPALFTFCENIESMVVVVDILRATTAICTAFENGVDQIIPVAGVNEALEYKKKGYMVAAERDGNVLDFADFGNSPFNFTPERVKGKTIVYSTTNGTQAISMAKDCYQVIVGSFINIGAICEWIAAGNRNVIILCAGWKNKFNLEDSVFAGAMAEYLMKHAGYETICDSTQAALDLWKVAKIDLVGYVQKSAQRDRLRSKGLDDVIEYCHTLNISKVVPVFSGNVIYDALKQKNPGFNGKIANKKMENFC